MTTEKMTVTSRQKYLPIPEPTFTNLLGIVDSGQVKQKMINKSREKGQKTLAHCKVLIIVIIKNIHVFT